MPDVRGWGPSGSSRVSAADIYWRLVGPRPPTDPRAAVWSVAAGPRVKYCCWRLLFGLLPSREALRHRGVQVEGECSVCLMGEEAAEHIFFVCPRAWFVWRHLAGLSGGRARVTSFQQLCSLLIHRSRRQSEEFVRSVVAYCVWGIWRNRNESVFGGQGSSPLSVVVAAISQAAEFWSSLGRLGDHPGSSWDSLERATLPFFGDRLVIWQSPSFGWLKVNFDGSLQAPGGKGGAGFVLRDFLGRLVEARSIPLCGISVPLAELLGAWHGIRCAVFEWGATAVWVEGDAAGVIKWLQGGRSPGGYAGGLLQDIEEWLGALDAFRVSYIPREGNAAADLMAGRGSSGVALQAGLGDAPRELLQILLEDSSGCSRVRRGR